MRISFEQEGFAALEVGANSELCDVLDGPQSPVFFGCKTGHCGTCLIRVDEKAAGLLPPPSDDEREMLEALAGEERHARLACRLKAVCDLHIRYLN